MVLGSHPSFSLGLVKFERPERYLSRSIKLAVRYSLDLG